MIRLTSIKNIVGFLAACIIMVMCMGCYEVHYLPGKVKFSADGGTTIIRSSKGECFNIRFLDADGLHHAPIKNDTLPDGTVVADETISIYEWAEARMIENGKAISISARPNPGKSRKLLLEVYFAPEWQIVTVKQKGR